MTLSKEIRAELCRYTANVCGLPLKVRSEFDMLSTKIARQTGVSLSATTLRRFFGYQETADSTGYSLVTVNTICQYIGCRDIGDFETMLKNNTDNTSCFLVHLPLLSSGELTRGNRIRVSWNPDRSMIIRYEGAEEVFYVEESVNGKLRPGDTFHCRQFVQGEQLYCKFVIRSGIAPMDYVCGKGGGIRFEVLG